MNPRDFEPVPDDQSAVSLLIDLEMQGYELIKVGEVPPGLEELAPIAATVAASSAYSYESVLPALLDATEHYGNLQDRIRTLEAENAGYRRSWASVNAAIEETGSYKP